MINEDLFESKTIKKWEDLVDEFNAFAASEWQWAFRGLASSECDLETTLERTVVRLARGGATNKEQRHRILSAGLDGCPVDVIERRLYTEFRRQYYHFTHNVPKYDNAMEWLSLMRHYGAPARLLDFTYSLFVATFFAMERAKGACIIWAINADWAEEEAKKLMSRGARSALLRDPRVTRERTFKTVFASLTPRRFVCPVNPERLDERLVIQQGIFFCPGDVRVPFEDNLEAMRKRRGPQKGIRRLTIVDNPRLRRDILERLQRMNMNSATLFPGLEGFARSLETYPVFARRFKRRRDPGWGSPEAW